MVSPIFPTDGVYIYIYNVQCNCLLLRDIGGEFMWLVTVVSDLLSCCVELFQLLL